MQIAQQTSGIQVLSTEQLELVSGGKLFGFVIGFGIGNAVGGVGVGVAVGNAVSDLEDWVNGN